MELKSGLASLQFKDIDMTDRDLLTAVIVAATPTIVNHIINAANGNRSRGCAISGSIHSGGGGSLTITCSV